LAAEEEQAQEPGDRLATGGARGGEAAAAAAAG